MKKNFLLLSLSLFLFAQAEAQNQAWAVTSDSSGTADIGYATDIDNAGNRYVAGYYADTLFIEGNAYPNYMNDGSLDAFVAKYDANGDLQWVQTINGESEQAARCLKVNRSTGEVYVSGNFYYDFYIDGIKQNTLTYGIFAGSFGRTFFAKFNTDGTLAWSNNTYSASGYAITGAYSLALSPDGSSLYLHSAFISDVQFEEAIPYYDSSFGASGVLLTKHDAATGDVITYRNTIPGYLFDGYILNTDATGNVIFAGSHRLNCMQDIDPVFTVCDTNPTPATSQGFILKMDANFGSIWGREISGTGLEVVTGLASDISGNVYACGTYTSDITFGGVPLDSVGGKYNMFVAKYSSSGSLSYVRNINADVLAITVFPYDFESGFAADKSGNTYIGGKFAGTLKQGTNSIVSDAFPSPHYSNGFLIKFDNKGKYRWGQKFVGDDGPFDVTSVHGVAVNGINLAACGHMVNYNAYMDDTIYSDNNAFWLSALQDCDVRIKIMASDSMVNASNPVTLSTPLRPGYSYQWQRNNTDIAGATSNTYITTLTGNYKCIVTTEVCTLTSNKIKLTLLPRLADATDNTAELFPNPAQNNFTITLPQVTGSASVFVSITDITGRIVQEEKFETDNENSFMVSLQENIPSGTYLVHVYNTSFQITLPLVVE